MVGKKQAGKAMSEAEIDEMMGLTESQEVKPETKSRRTVLLMRPSLYSDLEKLAYVKKTSVNELFNIMAEEYAANNKKLIVKYDDIMQQLEEMKG